MIITKWRKGWVPFGVDDEVFSMIATVLDEIEERAEENMRRTGKLEGMHYAALTEVRAELGIPRKKAEGVEV